MPTLASSSVSQLYTIPASDWTLINKRVGVILEAQPAQAFITQYLNAYPALLRSSLLWQQTTFNSLVDLSHQLANYADKAIVNFCSLNEQVKAVSKGDGVVTDELKQLTKSLLQQLAADTTPMASSYKLVSTQVLNFLNDNVAVDSQIAAHKDQLGNLWAPIGEQITLLENAAGLVVGEWQAITADLTNTLASPIDVTMAFLASLNIEAALVCWRSIQAEASAFPSMVAGQQQYWTNPTFF
ncbi:hypothetical protein [Spirosoma validum]|uniref:Uncharacterized protein n=1 Tax=Spirosoma validum TaxID=2771355 RepID=A0A927GCH0_9BACT|nr:hypothetical protein [Spirosoma validum]MBD2752515.1 hypothetical protein [Spirosoma validum]